MRVAILAASAPPRNAIGNLVAEKAEFFAERGAEVSVHLDSTRRLHPDLRKHLRPTPMASVTLLDADLVFFEYSQTFPAIEWLPALAGGHPRVIVDYFGVTPPDGWPAPQRLLLEESQKKRVLLWFADAITVLSRFSRDELVEATGLPGERIVQQRIPLDLDVFRPSTKLVTERQVLLFVGRLAPNKRLPVAIEALARLDKQVELWVAGDATDIYAEEAGRCRALAERLGVAGRVRWCGSTEDLPALWLVMRFEDRRFAHEATLDLLKRSPALAGIYVTAIRCRRSSMRRSRGRGSCGRPP